jgi:hypothetical protein
MKVEFKTGAKTKLLSYSFPTYVIREPSPGPRDTKGGNDLVERLKALEEDNLKMKGELERLHRKMDSQSIVNEHF